MWTRKLLKENGKIAFKRNYWLCVAVCLIAMLLGGLTNNNMQSGSLGSSTTSLDFEDDDYIRDELYPYMGEFAANDVGEMVGSLLSGIPSYVWAIFGAFFLVALLIGIALTILVANIINVGCSRFFIENREHKTGVGQLFYGFKNGRYGTTVLVMFLKNLYVFLWSLLFVIPGIIKAYAYALVPYILAENSDLDKERVFQMSQAMMKGHKWELFVLQLSFIGWNILGAITLGILNIFYVNPYLQATMAEFYSAVKTEAIQNGIVHPNELPGVSVMTDAIYNEVVVE